MQIGRVLNLRGYNKFIKFVLKNKLLILMISLFVFGVAFAVFSFRSYTSFESFSKAYLDDFLRDRQNSGFFKIFFNSFLSSLLFIVFSFIFGSSIFGVVAVPICVAVRGFLNGLITAYLYSAYSFEGVAFHAIILLLPSVIFTVALLLCSIEGVGFSVIQIKLTMFKNADYNLYNEFKNYSVKVLCLSGLVLLSAAADGILSSQFINSFKF